MKVIDYLFVLRDDGLFVFVCLFYGGKVGLKNNSYVLFSNIWGLSLFGGFFEVLYNLKSYLNIGSFVLVFFIFFL